MNKKLQEKVDKANELGKNLISLASSISGLDYFKAKIADMDLSLRTDKAVMPLVAFISTEDVEDIKSYVNSIVDKRISDAQAQLEKAMP